MVGALDLHPRPPVVRSQGYKGVPAVFLAVARGGHALYTHRHQGQGRRSWRRSRTRRSRGFRAKRGSFFPPGGGAPAIFFGFERARRRVCCTELRASSFCQVLARMLPIGPGGLQSGFSTLRYVRRDFRKTKSGPRTPRPPRWPPGPGFLSVARGRAA
jgi:hypothetical protein